MWWQGVREGKQSRILQPQFCLFMSLCPWAVSFNGAPQHILSLGGGQHVGDLKRGGWSLDFLSLVGQALVRQLLSLEGRPCSQEVLVDFKMVKFSALSTQSLQQPATVEGFLHRYQVLGRFLQSFCSGQFSVFATLQFWKLFACHPNSLRDQRRAGFLSHMHGRNHFQALHDGPKTRSPRYSELCRPLHLGGRATHPQESGLVIDRF